MTGAILESVRRSSADRYLYGVVVAGIVAAITAAVVAGGALLEPEALLLAAALALTSPTPLLTRTRGDSSALTVDELFLVPAFVVLPSSAAVVVAAVGIGIGLSVGGRWPAPWIRRRYFIPQRVAFNAAASTLAASGAAVVVWAIQPQDVDIAVALLGALVYSMLSKLFVAGIITLVSGRSFADAAREDLGYLVIVSVLILLAGGLLALAIVSFELPVVWTGLSVLLVLFVSAVTNRAAHGSERLSSLLAAAERIAQAGDDLERVTRSLENSARDVLDCHEAELIDRPPRDDETAVELIDGTWLHVAEPRDSYSQTFDEGELALLQALRSIATPALEHATAMSRLRNADDLKAAVLASVSHDVRTPLAVAKGTAELLVSAPDLAAERRQGLLENLHTAVVRVNTMIDGLLDLERYELGQMPGHANADVAAVVARVVRTVVDDAESNIVIDGDRVRARIDEPALERVLDNLVSNAVKHTAEGEPVVITYGTVGEGLVRLTVEDGGPGVPPERRLEIFEPFRHGGGRASVGLGLWVARRFVELRDGRIWVDEGERGGAAFHVELPAATMSAAPETANGRSDPSGG